MTATIKIPGDFSFNTSVYDSLNFSDGVKKSTKGVALLWVGGNQEGGKTMQTHPPPFLFLFFSPFLFFCHLFSPMKVFSEVLALGWMREKWKDE